MTTLIIALVIKPCMTLDALLDVTKQTSISTAPDTEHTHLRMKHRGVEKCCQIDQNGKSKAIKSLNERVTS